MRGRNGGKIAERQRKRVVENNEIVGLEFDEDKIEELIKVSSRLLEQHLWVDKIDEDFVDLNKVNGSSGEESKFEEDVASKKVTITK